MIFLTAGLLAVTGFFLVAVSAMGLRKSGDPGVGVEPDLLLCDAPSPDDSMRCDHEVGHFGWHRHGESEWWGDAWDCDHWAQTQEAEPVVQEPTLSAEEWLKSIKKKLVKKATKEAPRPAPVMVCDEPEPMSVTWQQPLNNFGRYGIFGEPNRRPLISVSPELAQQFGSLAGAVLGWLAGLTTLLLILMTLFR